MGRIDLDFNGGRSRSGSGTIGSDHRSWHGLDGIARRLLEGLREACAMAEWIKVGLPVLAAILSAYVMIQGHDIKINRLESDMRIHLDEHKKEAKDSSEKLSRIELAVERIEARMEAIRRP